MPDLGRVLGVDLGSKRIGLAVSDSHGRIAFPLETLERKELRRDLEALRALVEEREVERIVVGLPLHLNGRRGPEAEAAQRFASQLAEATKLAVDLIDERWTTREAERALRESGRRGSRRREVVDAVAAAILLRTYLEGQGRASDERGTT